jgi:ribosomal-protein-alanine N-acetyltransferase
MATLTGKLRRTHSPSLPAADRRPISIEPCRFSDLRELAQLHRRCFRRSLAYRTTTLFSLRLWPRTRFLIARSPQGIIGCAIGDKHGDIARVVSLCVDPLWQRHGIGSQLLAGIETALPEGPMILMVEEANLPARNLYDQHGYFQVGISRDYYGSGRHGIWMRKERSVT